jgi:hypothetical protein
LIHTTKAGRKTDNALQMQNRIPKSRMGPVVSHFFYPFFFPEGMKIVQQPASPDFYTREKHTSSGLCSGGTLYG